MRETETEREREGERGKKIIFLGHLTRNKHFTAVTRKWHFKAGNGDRLSQDRTQRQPAEDTPATPCPVSPLLLDSVVNFITSWSRGGWQGGSEQTASAAQS